MSDDDKKPYDLKDLCDPWSPAEAARLEALRGRAMVQLIDENTRLRAELDTVKKERDAARRSVEQWRDVLWGTLPMEVSRLACEQARQERDEARLRCAELENEIWQAKRDAAKEEGDQ